MKKIYLLGYILIFITSCTTSKVRYVGNRNTPTEKIDVYVVETSIKRDYEIVGKGYAETNWRGEINQEKMLKNAIEKAKKNGADAVFFKEIFIPTPGTSISTHSRTDSIDKRLITNSNSAITPIYAYFHKEMLFLKYK